MIAQDSIQNLSQRVDIVDIISHFVEVKKQGASFVCVCPFHNDKNPSMHINPQKGFYHCFACKAGGDVFKFVMEFEKLSFVEAVEKVADLSRFTLTYTKERVENKKDLKHILPLLNAFYKQNLSKHREVLDYLYQRSLNDEDIKKFELGFAPNSEESLRLLRNENIEIDDALRVGALKKDDTKGEIYASFIQRITFPIYDYKGLLVGFGGRTLNALNMAKYVNSPQSVLFDKSRIFYAFHLAKEAIAKQKEVIICEGYMDAIAFHKAGFKNAVAVLGTALTEQHLPLIKRYEAKAILCFDSDEAGFKAAMRSAFLLSTHKIDGKVVLLKGGKDPAELVAKGEAKMLFSLLEQAIELGEFYIAGLLREPLTSALEKQKALENIQKYTFLLEPLVANSYISFVAKLLGVDEKLIKLSRNSKKIHLENDNLSLTKERNNLLEFEVLGYLRHDANARKDFSNLSDKLCFKHQKLLEKILQNLDIQDSDIREFESRSFRKLEKGSEYLLGICKINLAFLNFLPIQKPQIALKKQLFSLLDKNAEKLRKNLDEGHLYYFLKSFLILLKNERNSENLELLLRKSHKIFSQTKFDFEFLRENILL